MNVCCVRHSKAFSAVVQTHNTRNTLIFSSPANRALIHAIGLTKSEFEIDVAGYAMHAVIKRKRGEMNETKKERNVVTMCPAD